MKKKNRSLMLIGSFALWCAGALPAFSAATIIDTSDVSLVWSGHPVGFAFITLDSRQQQFVAYYDKDRKMTAAARSLSSKTWRYRTLPSTLEWDSHNYIAMAVDDSGYIHISGNMHRVPLVYFRSGRELLTVEIMSWHREKRKYQDYLFIKYNKAAA